MANSDVHQGGPERRAKAMVPSGRALADRLGVSLLDLEVVRVTSPSPSFRAVTLRADALAGFHHEAGQDVMLAVPTGRGTTRRRYTIRSVDGDARTLTLVVVLHGDGPGARWAAEVVPGTRVEAIGPRGKVTLDAAADWQLFVGDDSFVPAALSMLEAAGSVPCRAVLEVDGPADELPVDVPGAALTWVHRGGRPAGDAAALVGAAEQVELPAGTGHAYVGGELRAVAAVRAALVARGMRPEQLSPKAYWRRGAANADHGEPERD